MGFASNYPQALPHTYAPPIAGALPLDALAEAMIERIRLSRPKSGAEALRELRTAFPDSPLALRVAALARARR